MRRSTRLDRGRVAKRRCSAARPRWLLSADTDQTMTHNEEEQHMSIPCRTCRRGIRGDDGYSAFQPDGTLRWLCADCDRLVGDPVVWAGGPRHGMPVRIEDDPDSPQGGGRR